MAIPQSVLAFIFLGRGSRTPFQVGLHKNSNNKTDSTQTRTGQTGLTGRPLSLPDLAVNKTAITE